MAAKKKTQNPEQTTPTNNHEGLPVNLNLVDIKPSKINRKRFSEEALANLASSIKAAGLIQPILVRPVQATEAEPEKYEIIAGERRWRASRLAGASTILAIVRELSDLVAAELQILENLQREDPHELEEALGYQNLMLAHGYSADDLVQKLHKSRSYIYGRLKLCSLTTELHEDFYSGKLSASTALDIARLPTPELQKRAAEMIRSPSDGTYQAHREARKIIQLRLLIDLSKATFPLNSKLTNAKDCADLPSCQKCPKRSGNQPEIFSDANENICTDINCFETKTSGHRNLQLENFKKQGVPVEESDRKWDSRPENGIYVDSGMWRLKRLKPSASNASLNELIPNEQLPKPIKIWIDSYTGKFEPIYATVDIQSLLEKLGHAYTEHEYALAQEKKAAKEKANQAVKLAQEQANKADADKETDFRKKFMLEVRKNLHSLDAKREVVKSLLKFLDKCATLRLGHVSHLYRFGTERTAAIENHIAQCDEQELMLVVFDLIFGESCEVTEWSLQYVGDDDDDFLDIYNIAEVASIDVREFRNQLEKPVELSTAVESEPFKRPTLKLPKTKPKRAQLSGPSEGDSQIDQMLLESEGAV